MSVQFTCGDPAGLAGYLYDECAPGERAAVEAHLAICSSCASELSALGATRTALASWTPPEATLGFRITSGADPHGRWWARPLPAWAQAAAAILIFAVGMALGIRAMPQPPAAAPERASVAAPSAAAVSAKDLAALEQRLRAEMAALRSAGASPAAAARPQQAQVSGSEDALMQRMRALLSESEERQERQLAVRLSQVLRDVDTQRRMDLLRVEQTFGQMEGFTRPELANQRQMINYLIQRTGAQRSPQE